MKLTAARVTALRLPLHEALATAHGPVLAREGALLEIEAQDGARGWGEALPLPGFDLESADAAANALVAACRRLVGAEIGEPDEALAAAARDLAAAPAARAALDTAWRDCRARAAGTTLAAHLAAERDRTPRTAVETGTLLAGNTADDVARAAQSALAAGFRTLKLKVGSLAFERDRERVAAARRAAPRAALRLDANGAWSESDAARHIDALAAIEPELLEQPVAFDALDAMARLRELAPFPLAADEAVRDLAGAHRLLRAGAADVLVLKPAAIGGPGATAAIAAAAREADVAVLVTTFLDGAIGRCAALHVAASLPASAYAAGLATGALLADDLAHTADPAAGELCVPSDGGLGVTPEPQALARLATAPSREVRT
ncbi:MAG: o-succinylbenzoate synthase [Deltaproteobacteria bacterium]|nr:o-succinylbenzoate synthase [Deltaproteobacteria bacterium]MBW2361568.1 o-succinylbenzoate synthase [Deltaproteobacteria bacterium]